jgi:8-oxo-dGTP pyrophosphatase MutT (NUDIX family)
MEAAAHGYSTLGIPRSVGKEFVAADAPNGEAAGILFVAPDGDVLLLRRSEQEENYAGHWGLPGGKAEEGEDALSAAHREASEELGGMPFSTGPMRLIDSRVTPNGMAFHTFACPVDEKFTPTLNDEHSAHAWAPMQSLPQPLHPGVSATLRERLGVADDMSPEDWQGLRDGFLKWIGEEEAETEHRPAANDTVAMDRSSVRRIDQDGHLFVEMTPISKANICPYYGREIPDWQRLGLDPDRKYQLLRDPEELERAAASFAGKPLLMIHTPVSADDHPKKITVGSVGTDVQFRHPYLLAPLSVWDGEAIRKIGNGEQKELSSSYRYRADMTPGNFEGRSYDGVMRDLAANHVALVREGRAGPDVVVGDEAMKHPWAGKFAFDETEEAKEKARGKFSEKDKEAASSHVEHREEMPESAFLKPSERKYPVKEKKDGEWKYDRELLLAAARRARINGDDSLAVRADAIRKREFGTANDEKEASVPKILLSRKAALSHGALLAYLAPKLANDAQIDLVPVVKDVTSRNFKTKCKAIIERVQKLTDGKLAADASIDDLDTVLDALALIKLAEDEMDPNSGTSTAGKMRGEADDEDEEDKKAKAEDADEEDGKKADDEDEEEAKKKGADDEDEEEKKSKAEDEDEEDKKDMVDKKAMDAAIDAAVRQERLNSRKIAEAVEEVRPFIGKTTVAFDSADEVYKAALKSMKVDITGVHPSAYRAILRSQPKPGSQREHAPAVAMDAAGAKGFSERFPQAMRITQA